MIRWGIIGAGNIAHRFATALSYDTSATLYAVACRTLKKAEAFREQFPCDKAYDSYDALLDDENIDVVYIALPHGFHFTWTKKAIIKGKAVLCEKPAMMNAKEMQEIKELSNKHNVFFMEAMKTRFVPLYKELEKQVSSGIIGDLTKIEVSFCSLVPYNADLYIYDSYQGGCLLDTGIYNMSYIDTYVRGDIVIKDVTSILHDSGVDTYILATLTSGSLTAVVECALDRKKSRTAILTGTKGSIVIEEHHRPQVATVKLDGQKSYTIEKKYEYDDFYSQIHHVNTCLQQHMLESPIMTKDDSMRCITILDAIKEAI